MARPMDYPVETLHRRRARALAPHFTNLDRPVFALVNLPETVKGALFARYSRYQGTLRRLYLDEFAGEAAPGASFDGEEGERARKLYERIFLGYGDDSVAQLGGAHIACEWVSNVMTKLLQRGRLAAYLEQSTRYIPYDAPIGEGLGYRYWRNPELGPRYEAAMDSLFDSYSEALPRVMAWAEERFPRRPTRREAAPTAARSRPRRSTCCAACCPRPRSRTWACSPAGQAYEQLLLRLFASPLPEARDYADMILAELKAVMPSFVARVERPDRGGEWISYLEERAAGARALGRAARPRPRRGATSRAGPAVRLLSVEGDEDDLLAALLFEAAAVLGGGDAPRRCGRCRPTSARRCSPSWSASAATAATGPAAASRRCATASRSSPTTAPSATSSAIACSPIQWQTLGPELGAGVPEELEQAGVADAYRAGLERSTRRARADRRRPAGRSWRPTRSASATGSATCST